MFVYRITNKKFANNLSGIGAAINGGRWNKKGTPVIYAGESREITLLETIVHTPPMLIPNLDILTLEIPDNSIKEIKLFDLPKKWSNYPAPSILSKLGEEWVKNMDSIALRVPSCIIHTAYNYILNCQHPDFETVRVIKHEDFSLDPRLIS
ncbi:MAG TPA: RES family NAD+ phosphorylase [Salinimicrobium sp.]|nr:RES family NAD+ phosphorylase [Salinimicrobium sp.]